jgi:CDP-glycerol glycerophosphotransferase
MVRDVAKWDYLISPSPTCSDIFRGAFGYEGTILETGYPRNDILKHPRAAEIRRSVRADLGVVDDALVVLYAPTWRDDAKTAAGAFRDPGGLDVPLLLSLLPEGARLLSRMHKVVGAGPVLGPDKRAVDVSGHPDIAELYLACDVLVSDYSSAIFDFAVTGKPIVCFAYDLEHYRNGLRHLYFDYEEWAPGPVVSTTEELADVLCRLETVEERYR